MFRWPPVAVDPEEVPLARDEEISGVLYTPDRLVHNPELTPFDDTREMIIVHSEDLRVGQTYTLSRRKLVVKRQTDKEEFLARCPQVPELFGIDRYRFYVAEPVD